jgi:hypothetical protein
MSARIYRYEVPVDDQWHEFDLGPVLAVGCRQADVVEFWAMHFDNGLTVRRRFIVVGTGHTLPVEASRHIGTAVAPGGQLVWHLMGES